MFIIKVFDLVRSEVDGKDVVKKETFHLLLKATIPAKSEQYHKVLWCFPTNFLNFQIEL